MDEIISGKYLVFVLCSGLQIRLNCMFIGTLGIMMRKKSTLKACSAGEQ